MSQFIINTPFYNLKHQSRVHPLRSLQSPSATVFVKREDELGVLSLGTKIRKYLSLIPFLKKSMQEVAIFGSPSSNNILALCLFLKESGISPYVFLQGKKPRSMHGNFQLISLLLEEEKTFWIDSDQSYEEIVQEYENKLEKSFLWVPQGSSCKHALPGALSLAEDIALNEKEHNICFDHIFVDAGTGFSAAALLLGLGKLQKKAHVTVVQLAGSDFKFYLMLEECKKFFQDLYGEKPNLPSFEVERPKLAKSFGSVSKTHMNFIKDFAKNEGILLDPIYNAKLFLHAKEKIENEKLKGNILLIESGGTFSLSGFSF